MQSRTPSAAALAASLLLAAVGPADADEVTDQLDTARKSYEAGDLRTAVDTLNFAVAKIQEQVSAKMLLLLPEPLEGWKADPGQSESGGIASMIAGTNLSRRYFKDDGAEVTLHVTADSPLLPMLTMFLSSPFMMQVDPSSKPFAIKGQRGMVKKEGDGSAEITLMVGNRILVQSKGNAQAGEAAAKQYLEVLDLGAIQKGFGG
jgi:hypothetical protein